jgi:hypothetical protein
LVSVSGEQLCNVCTTERRRPSAPAALTTACFTLCHRHQLSPGCGHRKRCMPLGAADNDDLVPADAPSRQYQEHLLWLRLINALYEWCEGGVGGGYESGTEPETFARTLDGSTHKSLSATEELWCNFRLWSDDRQRESLTGQRDVQAQGALEERCAAVLRCMTNPLVIDLGKDEPELCPRPRRGSSADIEVNADGIVVQSFADRLPVRYRDTRKLTAIPPM